MIDPAGLILETLAECEGLLGIGAPSDSIGAARVAVRELARRATVLRELEADVDTLIADADRCSADDFAMAALALLFRVSEALAAGSPEGGQEDG